MATPKTVMLSFQPNPPTLAVVDPEPLILNSPVDWVSWEFDPQALPPAESSLLIRFEETLGPFQALRGVGTQTLVATGNKGDSSSTSYSYFLYLLPNAGTLSNLIKAGPFTIVNNASAPNNSPWVHVTFNGGQVDIDPESNPLLLHEGDVAFVTFAEELDDHVVAFSFPTSGSTEGPFRTYFVTRQNGQGTVRLGGAVFGASELATISFGIRVWNAEGILVSHKDPSIDNLGRPPG